jgi:hypothetical protein
MEAAVGHIELSLHFRPLTGIGFGSASTAVDHY